MKSNKIFPLLCRCSCRLSSFYAVTFAASTISTNIGTGGTRRLATLGTLTGAVTLGTDLAVTREPGVGADASGGHITAGE